jgi:cytochrome c oxidase subunit 3
MTEQHTDYLGDKFGMWLFLFTEILLFGGLFLLYAVFLHRYQEEFHQGGLELSRVFGAANTVVLITSSFTVALAISALQQGRKSLSLGLLAATIALAGVFMVNKYFEWSAKIGHGIYPGSPELAEGAGGTNVFFGLYYVMTGAHGLHVVIGAAILGFCMLRIAQGRVTAENFGLLENGGLYWHLVDLVWIFLFPLFYLIS